MLSIRKFFLSVVSLLDSINLTNGTREDVEWLVNLLLIFFAESNNISNYYGVIIVCIHILGLRTSFMVILYVWEYCNWSLCLINGELSRHYS